MDDVLAELRENADPGAVEGMARFGISKENTLGVSIPVLRSLARRVGKDHGLAQELWNSEVHEGRILASMVDDPAKVTEAQMERWVLDFDSWDVCDECCGNLFDRTPYARSKSLEWAERGEEFVRRAGYVMMAELAVHDKEAPDSEFLAFFPSILKGSDDSRNFVKKAVNWALRQIGKRNKRLNREAVSLAREIAKRGGPGPKWVASDALRELTGDSVQKKLRRSS